MTEPSRDSTPATARSPLHVADYRRFWLTRFCSVLATTGIAVVLGWQVYDVARAAYGMSPGQAAFQLGIIGLVQFLPMFVLAPFAGLIADRFDRRKVGALAVAVDFTMALALAALTTWGTLTLPALLALGSLHGVARAFFGPSISAIGPSILPAALIPRSVSLNSMAMQIGTVGGPAAGGFLYSAAPSAPYWTAAGLLAVAMVCILSIKPFARPEMRTDLHPLRQIAEGFAYVRRARLLLGCITLDLFAVLLAGATALLPVYARDILTWNGLPVGPTGLGQMRAAPAVGAAAVALLLSFRPIERNVGVKMLWAVVVFGLVTVVFGLSRNYLLSLAMLVLLGAADMISMFVRSALVQLSTPDAMRGRIASISGLAISASNELGEMQSGLAAAFLGPTGAVVFGGIGAILITASWALIFPELRRSRSFATHYSDRAPA
ncbi:MFS transporter [Novosphingobium bradum]|uniref:MFS transporter n=1 Tax=Novosphingobium bradum TaxID=1737444 RepID=A0ABV7IR06_9SPHN